MMLLQQVNDTALLVIVLFGITLLAWRYLFEELESASAQVALAIYMVCAVVFFATSMILIWIH